MRLPERPLSRSTCVGGEQPLDAVRGKARRVTGPSCPVQGKLRIGLGAETLLVALAHAVLLHKEGGRSDKDLANRLEEASQAVKLAYSQCPSYDKLIPALLDHPVEVTLSSCRACLGAGQDVQNWRLWGPRTRQDPRACRVLAEAVGVEE